MQGLIKSFPSLFGGRPREVIGSRSCSKAEGEYIEVRPSVVVQICKGAKHHPYSPLYFAADGCFALNSPVQSLDDGHSIDRSDH